MWEVIFGGFKFMTPNGSALAGRSSEIGASGNNSRTTDKFTVRG